MGKRFLTSTDTFMSMYQNAKTEVDDNYDSRYKRMPSIDELWGNINDEGFILKLEQYLEVDPIFIYKLYSCIINDFARFGYGVDYLNQIWKVFAKIEDNGIYPTDPKAQGLYLRLAAENIPSSLYEENIDALNKTKFLIAGLDSFDTSQYFFGALGQLSVHIESSASYAYYADFLKKIAEVSHDEKLTYVILAEQIQRNDTSDKSWYHEGILLKESVEELRNLLYYDNHYVFSDDPNNQLFGKKIEELMKAHTQSFFKRDEREALGEYPILIKKPSKMKYVFRKDNYRTEDSSDLY
jgi:hypothetical protein